jgi:hypothetical protein
MTGRKQRGATKNPADRVSRRQPQDASCLGIFWLVDGKLIIDSSPLSEAEPYGDHLTHPRSRYECRSREQAFHQFEDEVKCC